MECVNEPLSVCQGLSPWLLPSWDPAKEEARLQPSSFIKGAVMRAEVLLARVN